MKQQALKRKFLSFFERSKKLLIWISKFRNGIRVLSGSVVTIYVYIMSTGPALPKNS